MTEEWEAKKARLTDPEFVNRLHDKTMSCAFGADRYESSTKARFPKAIMEDPIFAAIHYCRHWFRGRQSVRERLKGYPAPGRSSYKEFLFRERCEYQDYVFVGPYNPGPKKLLAKEFANAVMRGDVNRLRDMVKFVEIHEEAFRPRRKRDEKSWHYYAGIAAFTDLNDGIVPTKKKVKEWATIIRGSEELEENNHLSPLAWWRRIEESMPTERNWSRIFADLGLSDLPTAPRRSR
jgi:hypothetical protein